MHRPTGTLARNNSKTTKQSMTKIQEARAILRDAGYFVDNLWHIDDVMDNYECDKDVAYDILKNSITNDSVMSHIWEAIDMAANEEQIKFKQDD